MKDYLTASNIKGKNLYKLTDLSKERRKRKINHSPWPWLKNEQYFTLIYFFLLLIYFPFHQYVVFS